MLMKIGGMELKIAGLVLLFLTGTFMYLFTGPLNELPFAGPDLYMYLNWLHYDVQQHECSPA